MESDDLSNPEVQKKIAQDIKGVLTWLSFPKRPIEHLIIYSYEEFKAILNALLKGDLTPEKLIFYDLQMNEVKESIVERKEELRKTKIEKVIKLSEEKSIYWKNNLEKNYDLRIEKLEIIISKLECALDFLEINKRQGHFNNNGKSITDNRMVVRGSIEEFKKFVNSSFNQYLNPEDIDLFLTANFKDTGKLQEVKPITISIDQKRLGKIIYEIYSKFGNKNKIDYAKLAISNFPQIFGEYEAKNLYGKLSEF
jgi:hypothetical protein